MAFLHPIRLLLLSFLLWLAFFLVIPTEYLYSGSAFYPLTTLIFYTASFVVGFYSLRQPKQFSADYIGNLNLKSKKLSFLFFVLGGIGVLVKLYAGFFVTRIYAARNTALLREELFGQEFSSGAFGVIGALLFPFAVICMLLAWYNFKNYNKIYLAFATLIGIYPIIDTFFLGGRTTMVLLGGTIFVTVLFGLKHHTNYRLSRITFRNITFLAYPKFLNRKRMWIPILLLLVLFVSYSVKVISGRLAEFNYDNTLLVWEELHEVQIDDDFQEHVESLPKKDRDLEIGLYSLKHYFAHGIFEYIRLVNHLEKTSGYYYGMYEFHVFFKFFRPFGLSVPSFSEINKISYKPAVYTTFWGPFYIDFGLFGIAVIFIWGRYVRKVYARALIGHPAYVIFYGYLATIILASFFLNFLLGSSSYYLFGFIVAILLFKIRIDGPELKNREA
ncbi:hypothetical protein ACT6NV_05965 [Robiginitalea sp. IMCC44478]|uniref:hypothetical protein n=1 Tax=Robiginitalea sp. IMCC44478 TaxID=3459122 RepID=UPI004041A569